jgi:N-acetylglucosamine-6-phosphate deacetylase
MLLLEGGRVVTPDGVLSPGWIRLAGDVIDAVGSGDPHEQLPAVDLRGQWVLPGFIDMHVHGGGGASFTEGTSDQARQAAAFHRGRGSTTVPACWPGWPTTASSPACTWRARSSPRSGAAPRIRGT